VTSYSASGPGYVPLGADPPCGRGLVMPILRIEEMRGYLGVGH